MKDSNSSIGNTNTPPCKIPIPLLGASTFRVHLVEEVKNWKDRKLWKDGKV